MKVKTAVVETVLKLADATIFLAVLGFIGLGVAIARVFGLVPVDQLVLLTFALVSILCTAVAVGFLRLAKTVDDIKIHVDNAVMCNFVEGDAVWDSLQRLVSDGKKRIRATHFAEPEADDTYVKRIMTKLAANRQLAYEVIIGYRRQKPDLALKIAQNRQTTFTQGGVRPEQTQFRYSPTQWGMDLLIIDDDHLFVGLPTNPGHDKQIRCGLVFKNRRDVVDNFREWYDEYLWPSAENEPPG